MAPILYDRKWDNVIKKRTAFHLSHFSTVLQSIQLFHKVKRFRARNMRAVRYRSVLLNEFSHKSSSHLQKQSKNRVVFLEIWWDVAEKAKGQRTKRLLLINVLTNVISRMLWYTVTLHRLMDSNRCNQLESKCRNIRIIK